MTTARDVRRVILGTAGHIDHGKTTLVERLTGTPGDRLPEERARGMTIDLGYAAFPLDDGTEIGVLDVPGHEHFVHTMVAGAAVMDLALLVVAADDGPMPQTLEHVEILDLLGVTRLVVALTKIDLVGAERVAEVVAAVRSLIDTTGMRGAPIVPVSATTGEGMDALRSALRAALPDAAARDDDGRVFRMPLLRAFHVEGRGVVVTGVPVSGRIRVGDRVEVLPSGLVARVRAIRIHGSDAGEARVGQRTALALSDVEVGDLKRGMVVAEAGRLRPAARLIASARVLATARRGLRHRDRVRLHIGASRLVAQVHLPARHPLEPGSSGVVELVPEGPTIALPGDRFVLRAENASATLGGGVVIDLSERALPARRDALLERLAAREVVPPRCEPILLGALDAIGEEGGDLDLLVARTGFRPDVVREAAASLVARGALRSLGRGDRWCDAGSFARVVDRVEEALRRLHARDDAIAAWPLMTLRAAQPRLDADGFDAALADLVARGRIVRTAEGDLHHVEHVVELPARERALCDAVSALLARGAGRPPDEDELSGATGASRPDVERALRLLASRRRAWRTAEHWFDADWVETAKERLAAFAAEHGGFTPADARTLLDTTRKWLIPLLEALDKSGWSRRQGERRVVRANGPVA